jgi:hypothetical protein
LGGVIGYDVLGSRTAFIDMDHQTLTVSSSGIAAPAGARSVDIAIRNGFITRCPRGFARGRSDCSGKRYLDDSVATTAASRMAIGRAGSAVAFRIVSVSGTRIARALSANARVTSLAKNEQAVGTDRGVQVL